MFFFSLTNLEKNILCVSKSPIQDSKIYFGELKAKVNTFHLSITFMLKSNLPRGMKLAVYGADVSHVGLSPLGPQRQKTSQNNTILHMWQSSLTPVNLPHLVLYVMVDRVVFF